MGRIEKNNVPKFEGKIEFSSSSKNKTGSKKGDLPDIKNNGEEDDFSFGSNKNSKPGSKDVDFNLEPELKPVRPPPPIEYDDEEYSEEGIENNLVESSGSSSEVFTPPLPRTVTSKNNSTKKRKLKPKLKQWCPRDQNC